MLVLESDWKLGKVNFPAVSQFASNHSKSDSPNRSIGQPTRAPCRCQLTPIRIQVGVGAARLAKPP